MERKILIAVDGSIHTTNSLNYLCGLFREMDEVKFHLLTIVPCASLPPGKEWMDEQELMNCLPPAAIKKVRAARSAVKKAVQKLEQNGIAADRITSDTKLARGSIAADILGEARRGLYDSLVIGRRGLTKIEELVIGSISNSIVAESHDVPLWIVDGQVDSDKFLLPVDGSYCSLMAADHLAHIMQGNHKCRITLFHSSAMFGGMGKTDQDHLYELWGREWCEEHLGRPDSLFHAPKQILIEGGIAEDNITWLHTFTGIYPSRQILRQALIDGFGTIVIGRRLDKGRKGLFRGVSDALILMGQELAIWVVG
ncbi:MAG: universal stress protein [Proteobacteria bacterium]|nr:universal stress protein [Pseudomonadota bacterium]MBU1738994.1 universal stress protein [Pseudomonadota bacterium]